MTVTVPEYVRAQNNVSVFFLPAVANMAAPTVAEFTAGVDVTKYLPADWEGFTAEQAKGTQTRMALPESFEVLGRITRSISEFTYTYLPQGISSDAGNKVQTQMAAGTTGYLAVRYGISTATAPTTAQKVVTQKIVTGVQNRNSTGSDEFAPLTITQSVSAQGTPVDGAIA